MPWRNWAREAWPARALRAQHARAICAQRAPGPEAILMRNVFWLDLVPDVHQQISASETYMLLCGRIWVCHVAGTLWDVSCSLVGWTPLGGGFKGRQHNLWGTYDIYIGEPQTWWFAFNEKGPIGRWLPPLFKPPPKRYRASNPPSMAHDRDSDFLGCRSDFLASLSRYPRENTKSKCSTHQKKKNDVRTPERPQEETHMSHVIGT